MFADLLKKQFPGWGNRRVGMRRPGLMWYYPSPEGRVRCLGQGVMVRLTNERPMCPACKHRMALASVSLASAV